MLLPNYIKSEWILLVAFLLVAKTWLHEIWLYKHNISLVSLLIPENVDLSILLGEEQMKHKYYTTIILLIII